MSERKAIIYTDGSAIPNPGDAGWGNFGYTYIDAAKCPKPKDTRGLKGVSTEVVRLEGDKWGTPEQLDIWRSWGGMEGMRSNNEAEIIAATYAMDKALELEVATLEIRADSTYTIKGATEWMKGWKKRDWCKSDGLPVENQDLWKELDKRLDLLKDAKITLKWQWVNAHKGTPGNEEADQAAKRGGLLAKQGKYDTVYEQLQVISNEEKLDKEKPKVKKTPKPKIPAYSRLLTHQRLYFTTNIERPMSVDGRYVYFLGGDPEDELHGKRISDSCHSVVLLKNPDPVLEAIMVKQTEVSDDYRHPVTARMDSIRSAKNYAELYVYGADYVRWNNIECRLSMVPQGSLLTPKKEATAEIQDEDRSVNLTHLMNPPKLAFVAMQMAETHLGLLESYLAKDGKVVSTEVTELFYDSETDKKGKVKLVPCQALQENAKFFKPEVSWQTKEREGTASVVLTVGHDAPNKNMLSNMAKLEPKISVITYPDSDQAIHYAVVMETEEDCALFVAGYSNLCLV